MMEKYRKFETVQAVQYLGEPIPDVTCEGTKEQRAVGGCDNTRAHLPHVHTRAIGGLTVIQKGDWIEPVTGGPFRVWSDANFRAYQEVPDLTGGGAALTGVDGPVLVPAPEPAASGPGPVLVPAPRPAAAPAPGAISAASGPVGSTGAAPGPAGGTGAPPEPVTGS